MIRPAMNASRDNGVFSYRVSVLYNLFNLAVIPVLTGSFALDPHNLCVSLDCILSLHKKKRFLVLKNQYLQIISSLGFVWVGSFVFDDGLLNVTSTVVLIQMVCVFW